MEVTTLEELRTAIDNHEPNILITNEDLIKRILRNRKTRVWIRRGLIVTGVIGLSAGTIMLLAPFISLGAIGAGLVPSLLSGGTLGSGAGGTVGVAAGGATLGYALRGMADNYEIDFELSMLPFSLKLRLKSKGKK